jgi:hypothetical protein
LRYYQAQDTFLAHLADGTEKRVAKGDPLPETHELVKLDLESQKANPSRSPLFAPLGDGEPPRRTRRA